MCNNTLSHWVYGLRQLSGILNKETRCRNWICFPSLEDGKKSNFRNVVFSTYLEFRTMNETHKPSDFYCTDYVPLIERISVLTKN
jgi:hypothetical protein